MAELLFKDEVYSIVGAAMEVYNQLGSGCRDQDLEWKRIVLTQKPVSPFITRPRSSRYPSLGVNAPTPIEND